MPCLTDEQIHALLARSLPTEQFDAATEHLAECAGCRLRVNDLRSATSFSTSPTDLAPPKGAPHMPNHTHETMADLSKPELSKHTLSDSALGDFRNTSGDMHAKPAAKVTSPEEFRKHILDSGLMSAEELAAFDKSLPPDAAIGSVDELAKQLVDRHKLTGYQVENLRLGKTHGMVLGNYMIMEKLGEGGMGMVFTARHRRMKRTVALKVLPPGLTNSPDAIGRFHREVEAAAKLTHPNIAAAFDADEADGVHFLVMECVDGPNLSNYVKQVGPLPVAAAVRIMSQAARGLWHAHSQGVVHRDIKPGNLLINRDGVVKILDMGLAQLKASENEGAQVTELTQSGRVMGTVDYMAPEQALDAKHVDARADIYSLGATLYFLLTGKTMSPEGTLTQKLLWHQTENVGPLSQERADVPEAVENAFRKMVAKKPENRQQSMEELAEELDACAADLPAASLASLPLIGEAMSQAGASTNNTFARNMVTMVDRPTRTDLKSAAMGDQTSPSLFNLLHPKKRNTALIAGVALGIIALGAVAIAMLFGGDKDKNGIAGTGSNGGSSASDPTGPAKTDPGKTDPGKTPSGTNTGATTNTGTDPKVIVVPKPPEIPYEKLLKWVFSQGGSVTIGPNEAGGQSQEVKTMEALPKGNFPLLGISLAGTSVQDADLPMLLEAKGLQSLSLARTAIGDDGLVDIRRLESLRSLDLAKTKVTNKGLANVARFIGLLDLNLEDTGVTDQGLSQLASLKSLEKLYLGSTRVGDAGIKQLEPVSSLRKLAINNTYVTDEGYDSLLRANPQVQVAWDGRDLQRSVAHKLLAKNAALSLVTVHTAKAHDAVRVRSDLPQERFSIVGVDLSSQPTVVDEDLKDLAALGKIETLKLGGTSVTMAGLPHLYGLSTLKEIDLGTLPIPVSSVHGLEKSLPGAKIATNPKSDPTVVAWLLSRGGKVTVETPDGESFRDITAPSGLPKGDFTLRAAYLDGGSSISDEDLAKFKDLNGLETLYVAGNSLTDAGLGNLTSLRALRDLSLSGVKLTEKGLAKIALMRNLRQLYLAGCTVPEGALVQLAGMSNLTHLSLQKTEVTDGGLIHLKGLTNLVWLNLADNPLSDAALPHIQRLKGLKEVSLTGTKITDGGSEDLLASFPDSKVHHAPMNRDRLAAREILKLGGGVILDSGELTKASTFPRGAVKIVKLDLSELPGIMPGKLGGILTGLENLEELNLSRTSIADDDLAALASATKLRSLSLGETRVSDKGLAHLASLAALTTLDLQGTRITGEALSKLSGIKGLTQLYLGQTRVDDEALLSLKPLTSLTRLDLSGNSRVTDAGLASLEGMAKLELLILRGTGVTDAGFDQIAKFTGLRLLDVSSTGSTDGGLGKLKDSKSLQVLRLDNTKISDSTLSMLADFKGLKLVSISKTAVTKEGVDGLKRALPDCQISSSAMAPREDDQQIPGGIFGR